MTCISCPMGCEITVTKNGEEFHVEGNRCKRGAAYAYTECTHPVRVLTSTVRAVNGELVPIRSEKPIPKESMKACMEQINRTVIFLPVKAGDAVIPDIGGTGTDMIVTKSVFPQ